jgi:hypothetical protein
VVLSRRGRHGGGSSAMVGRMGCRLVRSVGAGRGGTGNNLPTDYGASTGQKGDSARVAVGQLGKGRNKL